MMGGVGGPGNMFLNRETSKPASVGATLARFWSYFSKYRLILVVVGVLVVASTYMQVLTPNLLGQAVDCYITPATRQAFEGAAANLPAAQASAAQSGAATNCWYATVPPNATTSDYIAGLGGLVLVVVGLFVASAV